MLKRWRLRTACSTKLVEELDATNSPSVPPLWWLRGACFFQVFAFGIAWPFEGVWMRQHGLGESLIGAISSLSTGVLLLAGLGWGLVADRTGRPDLIVLAGCLGVAVSLAWLTFCRGPIDFVYYAIGRGLSMPMISNLMPILAIGALGTAAQGRGYALYRIFGSFGYILSTLLLPRFLSVGSLFWAASLSMLAACLPLSQIRPRLASRQPAEPKETESKSRSSVRQLLAQKEFVGFLLAGLLFSLATPAVFTFTAVYARELGADQVFIGLLAASQGVIAVVALPLTGAMVDRFGVRLLLWLGFLAQPLRAASLGIVDDYHFLLLPQALHFFTWAGFEVAGVLLVNQLAPENGRATAQSLFRASQVLGSLIGASVCGYLAEFHGYGSMYFTAAALAACGCALFSSLLWRRPAR